MAEKVAARWLLDLLRLPEECSVGFVTGATMAGFVCLAAARSAVLAQVGWDVEADGLVGAPAVRVFVGEDAHVSVLAALRYLGFGSAATRVPTDAQGRMDAAALRRSLALGAGPAIVIAQAGQINTGDFDPVGELAGICRSMVTSGCSYPTTMDLPSSGTRAPTSAPCPSRRAIYLQPASQSTTRGSSFQNCPDAPGASRYGHSCGRWAVTV
jgi:glutamate/tyrosine decarboxylase-like PLP-dependent enzyme